MTATATHEAWVHASIKRTEGQKWEFFATAAFKRPDGTYRSSHTITDYDYPRVTPAIRQVFAIFVALRNFERFREGNTTAKLKIHSPHRRFVDIANRSWNRARIPDGDAVYGGSRIFERVKRMHEELFRANVEIKYLFIEPVDNLVAEQETREVMKDDYEDIGGKEFYCCEC